MPGGEGRREGSPQEAVRDPRGPGAVHQTLQAGGGRWVLPHRQGNIRELDAAAGPRHGLRRPPRHGGERGRGLVHGGLGGGGQ